MADTKITALAAITTVAPANDLFAIVDVSDNSMAASGTTKNITTNQILGAGGTATLASATITGALTVGNGTSATQTFNGVTNILDIGYGSLRGGSAYGDVRLWTDRFRIYNNAGTQIIKNISGTNGDETWYDGAGGTRMTLNSTGLGVGASPNFKLDVAGAANSAPITLLRLNNTGTTGGGPGIAARLQFNAGATALGFVQGCNFASGSIGVQISGDGTNIHQTIDSSGNVGIGVTPSATWATNRRALQIGGTNSGAIALNGTSGSGELFFNSFFNTSSQNICVVTGGTGKYDFNVSTVGCHTWSVGTGTAGTAFTFTPAMVLDASGNLLLGTVTSPTGTKIGSISKLGSVCVEGSNAISVSTTPVALARIIGTGGLFFVSGFNTSGGAQGWWLVASIGGTAPTVIASGNNTGLTVAFTNVSGVINMNTVSGTLSVTSFAITNSL